jgi:hypothetical protein
MPGYNKVHAKHYYNFTQLEVKAALLDYLERKGIEIPNGSAKVVLFIQEH